MRKELTKEIYEVVAIIKPEKLNIFNVEIYE